MTIGYSDITAPGLEAAFGSSESRVEPMVAPAPLNLFVFWVTNRLAGTIPRVTRFDDTPQGRGQAAALVRSETVLAVIRGYRAEVEVQSSVTVTLGTERLVDQVPLTSQDHPNG